MQQPDVLRFVSLLCNTVEAWGVLCRILPQLWSGILCRALLEGLHGAQFRESLTLILLYWMQKQFPAKYGSMWLPGLVLRPASGFGYTCLWIHPAKVGPKPWAVLALCFRAATAVLSSHCVKFVHQALKRWKVRSAPWSVAKAASCMKQSKSYCHVNATTAKSLSASWEFSRNTFCSKILNSGTKSKELLGFTRQTCAGIPTWTHHYMCRTSS